MTIYGVDVASYQGRPNWAKVKASGISFGFSKVTEGGSYVNPTWGHNRSGMLALGASSFVAGAYHFLRSDVDPARQVAHFLAHAGNLDHLAVALDVEPRPDVGSRPTAAQARAWVTEFKRRTGNRPVLGYFPGWWWAETGRPSLSFFDTLWQSRYLTGAGSPSGLYGHVPSSWWGSYGNEDVSVLQFSSKGEVPGVSGRCDVNAYRGSVAQLGSLLLGSAPVPPPKPTGHPKWPGRLITQPPVMRGDDVRAWQGQMKHRGWRIAVDGVYGPASETICRAFQTEKKLAVDGVVGRATWDAAWAAPVT